MSRSGEFDVRAASWVRRVTDDLLVEQVGEICFERGQVYAEAERVRTINTGDRGRLLLSTVEGSRDRPYTVMVTCLDDRADQPDWTSRCSCPVSTQCKHVAATLLAAREQLGGDVDDDVPAWRRFVNRTLEAEPTGSPSPAVHPNGQVPLGLRFGLVRELLRGRPTLRVSVTPAHLTKLGNWSKQTAWDEIAVNKVRSRFVPAQAEAVAAIQHGWLLAQHRPYRIGSSAQAMYLDEFGRSLWGLLADAVTAGVSLLSSAGTDATVVLVPESATVTAGFERRADGSLIGSAQVRTAAGDTLGLDPRPPLLIGDPVHGVVQQIGSADLRLAGLDRPSTGATMQLLRDGPVEVPTADAQEFVDLYLPQLRRTLPGPVTEQDTPGPTLRLMVSSPEAQTLRVDSEFSYASRYRRPVTPDLHDAARDRSAELALVGRVEPALTDAGLMESIGGLGRWPRSLTTFAGWSAVRLAEQLDALGEQDDLDIVIEGELPTFEESRSVPQISIAAADSAQTDWLDLHVTVTIDGEDVPFTPLFAALARGDEAMLLASGTWFSLDHPELLQLERLIAEARELTDVHHEGIAINRYQLGLWDELENLGVVDQQSTRWAERVARLRSVDAFATASVPTGLQARLRPYQLEGFAWLAALWDCSLGGILADDMGLGKTVQTLALVARAHEERELEHPVLVVAPSSVVGAWVGEAQRFVPELRVVALGETSRRRGTTVAQAAAGADLVVTSYAVLRLDADEFAEAPWTGLVLDEAQSVKNHQSKTFQAAKRVGAPFTLAITGTPLENSLMDLWSMLALVAPGLYPRPEAFGVRYRKPIERGEAPELLEQLRRRIRPLLLRRTKQQVAADLPPKQEQLLTIELSARHRQAYDRHLQRERQRILGLLDDPDGNRVAILASLTRLRQLALDPRLVDPELTGSETSAKLAYLVEQIAALHREGHRALVFSQFTSYLSLARDALTQAGLTSSYLDGRTRSRQQVIDGFKEGDQAAFLISLKAGGVGLTLTEADYVFVLDPWWNPAAEAQAVDRAHRIGQDRAVMVYRLVSADTIEEKVLALQERKRALFEQVVDGGGLTSGAITPDDLRALLD